MIQWLTTIPFFEDNNGTAWHGWISAAFTMLGAVFLSIATFYHCKTVWVTKDTSGLETKFMVFSCGTATLMSISSLCSLLGKPPVEWVAIDTCFIFVNLCSLGANAYTYKKKKENIAAAQRSGMTEQEYYNRVVLPTLDLEV
ncbi:hypothetical protein [Candidatus Mycoplasma haematominutum]|uniref:Uncharacterized protein n=1 Tax=Candidatus Mycoplasma haematominutum 'Birmingham 1' TaxID=1116213 RepID=G8C3Z1_9MOLU|nr:hypothetical protein [Candidatus Mycoplasma haematominutum]CCE67039.1 conserved haemoplasma hypothetical protein [Candidatus Mycoplasma haematominutum 'Birmingham 1']